MAKIKIAQYWGAGCGGCDVALLDIDKKILGVAEIADIAFWPIAVDTKIKYLEAMPDKSITATLYNGAIRNSENEHMAKLLRQKSVLIVSFGSCACFGGIPGLANVTNAKATLDYVYNRTFSSDHRGTRPTLPSRRPTPTCPRENLSCRCCTTSSDAGPGNRCRLLHAGMPADHQPYQ